MGRDEVRRILLDGVVTEVAVRANKLVAYDGRQVDEAEAVHLAPVIPTKIICIHLNYRSRLIELGMESAVEPTYFHKSVSALNAHRGAIVRPRNCKYLNYEGELAVVIGRTARRISVEQAREHIAGYVIANDFGLHDFRDTDANSMVRVKGSDTLAPIGPGLVRDWTPADQAICTKVNGNVVQEDSIGHMIWSPEYLVADLARNITLNPGDVIFTGTPANSRPVSPGDVVTVEIEGLGQLTNHVVEGEALGTDIGAQPSDSSGVRKIALGNDVNR